MASIKNAKGFTLVELMIVISIIGVLAVTLMPVLTGAQARSRDAGRLASINNIGAALSTYNSDNGKYPQATATSRGAGQTGQANCISNAAGATATDLEPLLKGNKMPTDPQTGNMAGACALAGVFGYASLTKDGITDGGYYLVANMETYQKANFDWTKYTASQTTSAMSAFLTGALSTELSDAKNSVYVIIN